MRKYKTFKSQLENATSKEEIVDVYERIKDAWTDIQRRCETETFTRDYIIKWMNLYDAVCDKYLRVEKPFDGLPEEHWLNKIDWDAAVKNARDERDKQIKKNLGL